MREETQELYEVLTGAYGPLFRSIEMWACIQALDIKPYVYNGRFYFSYSYLAKCDFVGSGEILYEAACNFYKAICTTKVSNK